MKINRETIRKIQLGLGIFTVLVLYLRTAFSWNPSVPAYYYFTVISNLLCAFYWIYSGVSKKRLSPIIHTSITLYMLITGVVFSTIIQPEFSSRLYEALLGHRIEPVVYGIARGASFFTHYLFPLLIIADYMFLCPNIKMNRAHYRKALLFPVLYSVFHSVYGLVSGSFLYPFLDPSRVGGWFNVILIMIVLTAVFAYVLTLLCRLKKRVTKRLKKREIIIV
jgi:hypothetical protein